MQYDNHTPTNLPTTGRRAGWDLHPNRSAVQEYEVGKLLWWVNPGWCQVPTKATLPLPSTTGHGREKHNKRFMI